MIVFVNGAFGIGKTTVAQALVARLPGSLVFDPEHIGFVLQRGSRLLGNTVEDFQDLALWRRLTVIGLRAAKIVARDLVVPMAFSDRRYLREVLLGAARFDSAVHHFCLIAPEHLVHQRLRGRGADPLKHAWQFRRASECCAVHSQEAFSTHIQAVDRAPDELAVEILSRIRLNSTSPALQS